MDEFLLGFNFVDDKFWNFMRIIFRGWKQKNNRFYVDRNAVFGASLTDFSKAFNCVPHSLLIHKQSYLEICITMSLSIPNKKILTCCIASFHCLEKKFTWKNHWHLCCLLFVNHFYFCDIFHDTSLRLYFAKKRKFVKTTKCNPHKN